MIELAGNLSGGEESKDTKIGKPYNPCELMENGGFGCWDECLRSGLGGEVRSMEAGVDAGLRLYCTTVEDLRLQTLQEEWYMITLGVSEYYYVVLLADTTR